jgi:hypothetical protein
MSVGIVDEFVAFGVRELPFFDLAPTSDVKAFVETAE